MQQREPALKNLAGKSLPTIQILRIAPVELTHPLREIAFGRFDDEMIMTVHLAPGMTAPAKARTDPSKDLEPAAPVVIVAIDRFPAITARRHVINGAGVFDSEGSCHGKMLLADMLDYKT